MVWLQLPRVVVWVAVEAMRKSNLDQVKYDFQRHPQGAFFCYFLGMSKKFLTRDMVSSVEP